MKKQNSFWLIVLTTVTTLIIGGVLVLAQIPAQATAQTTAPAGSRTLTVVGEGTVKIKPDLAQVNVGVEVVKPELQEANSEASRIMDEIMAGLKAQGVADNDMQTSGYNIWLERPYIDGAPSDQTLYHVTNQVNVTIRDLESVGAALDAAISAGANSIYGISFSLADPSQVKASVQAKAMADAQAKAQELAKLSGATLGEIVSVSEVIGNNLYTNSFQAYAAQGGIGGGAGPVSPGELALSNQVEVVFNLE
jgi:hypothetical protein